MRISRIGVLGLGLMATFGCAGERQDGTADDSGEIVAAAGQTERLDGATADEVAAAYRTRVASLLPGYATRHGGLTSIAAAQALAVFSNSGSDGVLRDDFDLALAVYIYLTAVAKSSLDVATGAATMTAWLRTRLPVLVNPDGKIYGDRYPGNSFEALHHGLLTDAIWTAGAKNAYRDAKPPAGIDFKALRDSGIAELILPVKLVAGAANAATARALVARAYFINRFYEAPKVSDRDKATATRKFLRDYGPAPTVVTRALASPAIHMAWYLADDPTLPPDVSHHFLVVLDDEQQLWALRACNAACEPYPDLTSQFTFPND